MYQKSFFLNSFFTFNPLNAKLNPICHLLALLGAHPMLTLYNYCYIRFIF
jgi:hypothetical protein